MLFGTCDCHSRSLISRRRLLCVGGAGFVSSLVSTLAGNARTARAQALGSRVPEVDRVAVRVITDNQVVQFVASEKRNGLTIERRTSANLTPDAPPRTALHGEWGFSMHVESQRDNEVRNVLIDFGYTPETLINNIRSC
jgi:7,8-dihydropterin-6-yl-methyl-4-(beta-D-ribofuranosyl)aminobenzene 5'-phosphate synthase